MLGPKVEDKVAIEDICDIVWQHTFDTCLSTMWAKSCQSIGQGFCQNTPMCYVGYYNSNLKPHFFSLAICIPIEFQN